MAPRLCLHCQVKKAALKRPRTGDQLCRDCFFEIFEDEIHRVIVGCNDGQGMFRRGEKVAIAASGGKDSTVLAHVMKTLNDRYNYGLDLFLLSIDEGITGYRDDSLETVKQNQIDYGLPLKILSYSELYRGWTMDKIVSSIGKKGNCTFCGVFRRQALDRGAAQLQVEHIVTGHNADDVAETVLMNVLRGDIARLERSAAITTMGTDDSTEADAAEEGGCGSSDPFAQSGFAIKRSKPFKYTYEKEIVLYAYFKKLVYFSTECIYSPNAYRGYARTYLKQLEAVRSRAILDIVKSGEVMATMVKKEVKRAAQSTCERCGYISSNPLCKACVLLESLEKGAARLSIGKGEEAKVKELRSSKDFEKADRVKLIGFGLDSSSTQISNASALRLRGGHVQEEDLGPVFYRQTPRIRKAMSLAIRSPAAKYVEGSAFITGLGIALDTVGTPQRPRIIEEKMLASVCKILERASIDSERKYSFSSLVDETERYCPPDPGPRSPELQKILDKIQYQNEEMEYQRMTSGMGTSPKEASLGQEIQGWRQANEQVKVILNIGVSMFACALAAWHAARASGYSVEAKTCCAMLAAIGIAGAEAFLYMRSLPQTDRPKRTPMKMQNVESIKKDKKQV